MRVFGNSLGFLGGFAEQHAQPELRRRRAGSRDEMQRDYWYSSVRDWRDLEDGVSIGKQAAARALRRLNARKLSTVTAPVLFVPELARGLFGHFLGAIRGGSQYRRASFLLDAAGEQVFPEWLQISERPHIPQGAGQRAVRQRRRRDARSRDRRARRADRLRAEHVLGAQARAARRRATPAACTTCIVGGGAGGLRRRCCAGWIAGWSSRS